MVHGRKIRIRKGKQNGKEGKKRKGEGKEREERTGYVMVMVGIKTYGSTWWESMKQSEKLVKKKKKRGGRRKENEGIDRGKEGKGRQ